MNSSVIHIKNMVCTRCLQALDRVFRAANLPPEELELGRVVLPRAPTAAEETELRSALSDLGFAWLDDPDDQLISAMKTLVVQYVHGEGAPPLRNWSAVIAETLHHDYSYLSRLFSQQESMTVEQFIQQQRIERVKELLSYGELTIAQIADRTGYGSAAYLSRQFRKVTGASPSAWQRERSDDRQSLDTL